MTDDRDILAGFGGVARLFPLPNLVLFPHVIQGLHVFEPRYRQLMADTLAGDGTMAIVLLKPGWEPDYDDRPAVEAVGCLGAVTWHEELPDGRYNLRLRGVSRVRLVTELPAAKKYRQAMTELLPDDAPDDLPRLTDLRRKLAAAVLARFPDGGTAQRQLRELFDGDTPLGPLTDILAYALPLPLESKQQLLAEPRVAVRAGLMAAAFLPPRPAGGRALPPEFSAN